MRVHRPLALNGGQQHFATVHEGSPNPTLYRTILGLGNLLTHFLQTNYSKSVPFGQWLLRMGRSRNLQRSVNSGALTRGLFVLGERPFASRLTARCIQTANRDFGSRVEIEYVVVGDAQDTLQRIGWAFGEGTSHELGGGHQHAYFTFARYFWGSASNLSLQPSQQIHTDLPFTSTFSGAPIVPSISPLTGHMCWASADL